ncbi:pentapeptide repeat-containing protein [Bradyrhizobium sp. CER78]|uniref:pentapeptide repeat-containing protein n=1 Tax=Bradyrhizobium sp. CER78 TaxID=3039162 RepID=UPI00244A122A|nr:pentapeptide repeat-containing protein [Bradyrhizobium sp. CER78]MDH2381446.1 pentapeptide repeat-containing protein [Bradyrhizobium sp. CER78]
MPASNDDKAKDSFSAFYLDRSAFLALPAFFRASGTVSAIIAVMLFIVCAPLCFVLLFRLGFDAVMLPNTSYQDSARNFLVAFIGVFGAPFLVWRTWVAHQQATAAAKQASVALENHITSIFSKSVELLGGVREIKTTGSDGATISRSAPNIESRLGGLYSLERLLDESEKDQRAILETLCAYIRENSPFEPSTSEEEHKAYLRGDQTPKPTHRSDVQAALTIIGRRSLRIRERATLEGWRLNFRNSNLVGYDLSSLNFDRSDLTGSFLNFANLNYASFEDSVFETSTLQRAKLTKTCFRSSRFKHCLIKGAEIDDTDFRETKIDATDLREATISSFDISGADLREAFDTYLEYTINRLKSEGATSPFDGQEVSRVVQLFSRAKYDERTQVSQGVSDAIAIWQASRQEAPPG